WQRSNFGPRLREPDMVSGLKCEPLRGNPAEPVRELLRVRRTPDRIRVAHSEVCFNNIQTVGQRRRDVKVERLVGILKPPTTSFSLRLASAANSLQSPSERV